MSKSLFLFFGLLASQASFAQSQPVPRIINGSPGSIADYPWLGHYEAGCGGTLIAPEWFLTAAHCFNNDDNTEVDTSVASLKSVTFGSDNVQALASGAQQIAGIEVIVHPDYHPAQGDNNDIALLHLATPVTGISPMTLMADTELADGFPVKVMGWGATAVDVETQESIDPSSVLLEAHLQTVSQARCQAIYGSDKVTDNMLCLNGVHENDNSDTCQGDSGGPAVATFDNQPVQIGVVSFGGIETSVACGDPTVPGVYTRVARYQSWILQQVPEALFYSAGAGSEACATRLDANLNIDMPCLIFQGQTYQTKLWLISQEPLVWEWENRLSASNCPVNVQTCVSVGDDIGLHLRDLNLDNQRYQAHLKYAPDYGPIHWSYQSHTLE